MGLAQYAVISAGEEWGVLHDGKLSKDQVRAWALNRYYYQSRIPAKDAALLARLPTAELRREWRRRRHCRTSSRNSSAT